MTLKRLFMPTLVMGAMLAMSSMVYGQILTCGVGELGAEATAATINAASTALIGGVPAPTGNATATGLTEPAGAGATGVPTGVATTPGPIAGGGLIRIACNPGTGVSPGVVVLTLSFGVPIVNSTSYPTTTAGIRVANGSGDFITGGATANVTISSVSTTNGTITIGLGTGGPPPNTPVAYTANRTSTFDVAGVLLAVCGNGSTVSTACPLTPTSVSVTMASAPGGTTTVGSVPTGTPTNTLAVGSGGAAVNFGGTSATVISAVTAGISAAGLAPTGALPAGVVFPAAVCTGTGATACGGGPAALSSTGIASKTNFVMKITEGFAGEFKPPTQFNGGGLGVVPAGSQGVEVWVTLANVPTGFSVGPCSATLTTDATGATADVSGVTEAVTQINSTGQIKIAFGGTRGATSLVTQETLWLGCPVALGGAATPLSTAITAQVEVAPIAGTALGALGAVQTALGVGNVPRYEDIKFPATGFSVVVFPPSQTTLLIPFAVVAPGINTGIAIANTSTDVFGAANGGATPTAGTITFTMYPQAGGTPLTSTTASIASGGLYANNLSGILPSGTTSFTGYIFATCNFSNAHGSATIYDATTGHAELSAPVLVVIANGGNVTAVNSRLSPEGLNQ